MATVITPGSPLVKPPAPRWQEQGEEVVVIALDANEVGAIQKACREYHQRAVAAPGTPPTSYNGAGARVYVALKATNRGR